MIIPIYFVSPSLQQLSIPIPTNTRPCPRLHPSSRLRVFSSFQNSVSVQTLWVDHCLDHQWLWHWLLPGPMSEPSHLLEIPTLWPVNQWPLQASKTQFPDWPSLATISNKIKNQSLQTPIPQPSQGKVAGELGLTCNKYGHAFWVMERFWNYVVVMLLLHSEYTKNYFSIVIVCYGTYISIFFF